MKQIKHHHTQFFWTKQLMSQHCSLTKNLCAITFICSKMSHAVLCDMINLYQQNTEVTFHSGLKSKKCFCAAKQWLKIDMFVTSFTFQAAQTLTFILNQKASSAEMKSHIQLLQEETQNKSWICEVLFCLQYMNYLQEELNDSLQSPSEQTWWNFNSMQFFQIWWTSDLLWILLLMFRWCYAFSHHTNATISQSTQMTRPHRWTHEKAEWYQTLYMSTFMSAVH